MTEKRIIQYKSMMAQHKQSLEDLEKLLESLNVEAITEENASLIETIVEKEKQYELLKHQYNQVKKEYADLRLAFAENILSEKMSHINASQKRIEKLFSNAQDSKEHQLAATENQILHSIQMYESKALILSDDLAEKYRLELLSMKERLKPDVEAAEQALKASEEKLLSEMSQAYHSDDLRAVNQELIDQTAQRKGFEFKWGLNVLNKVGVVLILLAVVLAGQYTYKTYFGDFAKGITFYLIGTVLLGVGEVFNRKRYTGLAVSLIGGGIGVLYSATFISTFYLKILPLWPALGISVLIAGVSIALSWVYRSQVLGALSIIGGYLPVFAYIIVEGMSALPVLGAIGYMVVLNGVILALSIKNRWHVVLWIGFVSNLICVDPMLFMLDNTVLAMSIALFNFITYVFIVIIRGFSEEAKELGSDIALLTLNTFGHVGVLYSLLNLKTESQLNGLIALGFGTFYVLLAQWLKKNTSHIKLITPLLMLAACFSILVVPMQFDLEWWFFGWLLEALFFMTWGMQSQSKGFEITGWILATISIGLFWSETVNVFDFGRTYPSLTDAKYLGTALAVGISVWLYRHIIEVPVYSTLDKDKSDTAAIAYRYLALVYSIIFLVGEGIMAFNWLIKKPTVVEMTSIMVAVVVITAAIGKHFNWKKWMAFEACKIWIYFVAMLGVFLANGFSQEVEGIRAYIEIMQIILQNYFAVITLNLLFKTPSGSEQPPAMRSLVISLFILGAYYLNFVIRIHTSYDGLLLNLSLIGFSIAYIVYGFAKRDGVIRKLGLFISFVATAKLLIVDSLALPIGQKIFSYFAFGVSMIAISYVYQRINAKWAVRELDETEISQYGEDKE